MRTTTISIRRKLLTYLLATIACVSALTLVLSYQDARHEVQELFDAQLGQSARVLQALLLPELLSGPREETQALLQKLPELPEPMLDESATALGHEYERKLTFQVWSHDGKLVLRSATAPVEALSEVLLHFQNRGYADEVVHDEDWRVFALWDDNEKFLIQVAERYDIREELVEKISRKLITPSLVSLPFLGLMIWVGIGRGLGPVQKVADEVTLRDPHFLQTMDIGPVPEEVRPLIEALNALFLQLQVAFDKERRFTDDAAHELRTPLAALKTQAQVAVRATKEEERTQALEKVIDSVDRANHLVEQMLTLARLDPQAKTLPREHLKLQDLAADVVAQLVPKAIAKDIHIEIVGGDEAHVYSEPVSLSILIRNLVDNAIRYTPAGGEVIVDINTLPDNSHAISVVDTGPGIDEEHSQRIYDRFFRVLGTKGSGCGLGLSIAKRIADLYQLRLEINNKPDEKGTGLVIKVVFPPAICTQG